MLGFCSSQINQAMISFHGGDEVLIMISMIFDLVLISSCLIRASESKMLFGFFLASKYVLCARVVDLIKCVFATHAYDNLWVSIQISSDS